MTILLFGIAIIVVWPPAIRETCCKHGICPAARPYRQHVQTHFQMTASIFKPVYQADETNITEEYQNQLKHEEERRKLQLQELIFNFFRQNNLFNNELLGTDYSIIFDFCAWKLLYLRQRLTEGRDGKGRDASPGPVPVQKTNNFVKKSI